VAEAVEEIDVTGFSVTSTDEIGHVNELSEWMNSLTNGKSQTIVTSTGARWSFNNDGTAHYLEFIDVTRREPNGRYKRVYKGKIEGEQVTHNRVTSRLEPVTSYRRWCQTPYGRKGRDGGSGENKEPTGDNSGRSARVSPPSSGWEHAEAVYIN
jgi:hypothetical protein